MGWFRDDAPGHEGFLVGFAVGALPTLFRELRYGDSPPRAEIARVAVACDCGWRSPHFAPPPGVLVEWVPYSLTVRPLDPNEPAVFLVFEEAVRVLWRAHVAQMRSVRVTDALADLGKMLQVAMRYLGPKQTLAPVSSREGGGA